MDFVGFVVISTIIALLITLARSAYDFNQRLTMQKQQLGFILRDMARLQRQVNELSHHEGEAVNE